MQKYLDVTGAAIYIKALVYKRISQIQLFNGDVKVSQLCMLKGSKVSNPFTWYQSKRKQRKEIAVLFIVAIKEIVEVIELQDNCVTKLY